MNVGNPQVTPVWVHYDGEYLLINTSKGRKKLKDFIRDLRLALFIQDSDNPYRKLKVRDSVLKKTEQGADEQIEQLAIKYTSTILFKTVHLAWCV
jgi:hypothetical protein